MTDANLTDLDKDDDNAMSFRQIMNMLVENSEIILTINRDDIPQVKRNLTSLKSRDAMKMKNAGLEISDDVLSYIELQAEPGQAESDVRLHIKLGPRKNVLVKKIELPDDTL